MGFRLELTATAAALVVFGGLSAPVVLAQDSSANDGIALPTIDVSSSRIGDRTVGSSTTIISSEDIERYGSQGLPQLLSQQAGIQIQHVSAGTNGARDTVDMRGFGASASSNVLVLVNGRRFNDFDLQGFDFSAIPTNSIERIEITRGNGGAVLYGDGAVGGVINIVTKTGDKRAPSARIESAFGSFRTKQVSGDANGSYGPWSASVDSMGLTTDGYRDNSRLHQKAMNGDLRYTGAEGSVYFNVGLDDQKLGLPGGRKVTTTSSQLVTDRTGAATPNDYGNKQGQAYTLGMTRTFAPGIELIVDGSLRRKDQQAELFTSGTPYNGVDSKLTTASFTPRLKVDTDMWSLPAKILTGFDYYHTAYGSDRSVDLASRPYHVYDIKQQTAAYYANGTLAVRPDTDVTVGGRVQFNTLSARDAYDGTAPLPFGSADAQGLPLDRNEWQWAAQLGLEHRINSTVSLFGHVARSFRVPNADERIGQAIAFNWPTPTPTNFDLQTQTSHEIEGGARFRLGALDLQSSVYDIEVNREIFYSPATGTNINLDPTRHWGVETTGSLPLSATVKLTGNLTYTRATFREGMYAGNDIPLISKWTGNTGVVWNVLDNRLVYSALFRYSGQRRLDNDSANTQPMIPAYTTVDMRLSGEVAKISWAKKLTWSVSVENIFNEMYYDYGIASTTTAGTFNAYPQPGRTFMVKTGATF
ncbi:MAG: TonB-dependent receptor [Rhodopseudomonas sp.]|nr:TonB-dependent receptor [Rhodopseudomonas sp.]